MLKFLKVRGVSKVVNCIHEAGGMTTKRRTLLQFLYLFYSWRARLVRVGHFYGEVLLQGVGSVLLTKQSVTPERVKMGNVYRF